MAIDLRKLLLDRAAQGIGVGGGLLGNQTTGGLLGGLQNINPNLLIAADIIGSGMKGVDPFSSVLPAVARTAQISKLLTPKDKRTPLQKNLESAGYVPGTPEYKQAMLAATAKTESGAGSLNLVSKANIDNAKISADYSLKGLNLIKRINSIADRSPDAFGIAGSFKGFGKDISTEIQGIYKDAINLSREGAGIQAGALSFIDNKDFSGIKPLQNSLKIILARSRNPNNRLLKDMLVEAGDDSDLRGLGGVQKAQEKLEFIAAELTDNAIRQFRAAGIGDDEIKEKLKPFEDIFKKETQQQESNINKIPQFKYDKKKKKLIRIN